MNHKRKARERTTNQKKCRKTNIELTSFCKSRKHYWLNNLDDLEMFKQKIHQLGQSHKIGEGTYGSVFKCVAPSGKTIALKKIFLENEKEGFPITAIREIKILKSIDHPNIVPLLDVFSVEGMGRKPDIFMVFEYLDHDLAGLMGSGEFVLNERHIKHCLLSLLSALAYLHDHCRLLHRDVKGSNILIDSRGAVKLADFGLSRPFLGPHPHRYTGRVVTLWYRAPELLLGEKSYTPAVDVWSAGCVFSELIFGKATFPGETEVQQLTLICKLVGSPTRENYTDYDKLPIKVNKCYPSSIHLRCEKLKREAPMAYDLLCKMLELDPKRRITAAEALRHDYFSAEPKPCPPDLHRIMPSHDYEARLRRRRLKRK